MKHQGLNSPPRRALATLTLALACYSAAWAQPVPVAEDPVMQDGLEIRLKQGKPIVGVDGNGEVEVAADPAGPWKPFREALPGARLEAELPIDAEHRFVRIRRPDGRIGEVQSALNGLPPAQPRFVNISAGGFDGTKAIMRATLPPDEVAPPIVPFFIDKEVVIFRDDGTEGDAVAGDRNFTGKVPVDIKEVEKARDFLNGLPPALVNQPVFTGRSVGGQGTDNTADTVRKLDDFLAGRPIALPIPIGVAPSATTKPIVLPAPGPLGGITPCNQLPTWQKTLLITDLSVVNDPVRSFDPCTGQGTPMGAWSFGKLMTDMANTPVSGISPSDFARRWLRSWVFDQSINNDPVPKRAAMLATILAKWEAVSGGPNAPLDMAKAPFRLLAIVNRLDLRGNVTYGGGKGDPCEPACNGGEGRFVFCFCDREIDGGSGGYGNGNPNGGGTAGGDPIPGGAGNEFLVIMEYCVPKNDCRSLHAYAQQWANLQCIPFGPVYNAALQNITDQFAGLNAAPGRPNNSALNQLRTNENLLNATWELREFAIFKNDSDAGHLRPVTVKQTPREDSDATAFLQNYITTTVPAPPSHKVPLEWNQVPGGPLAPFLGGRAVMMPISLTSGSNAWATTGFTAPNMVRHQFALNTCNGCHSTETNTRFTHVGCRLPNQQAPLSGFLVGDGAGGPLLVNVPGSPAGVAGFFDLQRREQDLIGFLLTPCGLSVLNASSLDTAAVH